MADHSKPVTTDAYATMLATLRDRIDDALRGLDPAHTSPTNLPTNAVRWTSAGSKWEKWNGTSWVGLSNGYAIPIVGGSVNNSPIGTTTPSTGDFTALSAAIGQNIRIKESDGNSYANFFRQTSSANAVLGYAVKYSANANAFASSQSGSAARGAVCATSGGFLAYGASAQTVSPGTDITMTLVMRCLVGQTLALEGATASSGTGVAFPATQSPSTDPNTLDDYREASYTATATGMTTSPTGTVNFVRVGRKVCLEIPAISGTSNSTSFTLTGGPTTMRPTAARLVVCRIQDNGAYGFGVASIGTDGTITLYKDAALGSFTASGTKSTGQCCIEYII